MKLFDDFGVRSLWTIARSFLQWGEYGISRNLSARQKLQERETPGPRLFSPHPAGENLRHNWTWSSR